MQVVFLIFSFVIGACFGSFLCCQARRMHIKTSPSSGKPKKGIRQSKPAHLGNRSICLSCHRQLKWYDNLPIISWLSLRGRCRYCKQKIGKAEIISELGLAIGFALLSSTINIANAQLSDWIIFGLVALLILTVGFLAIYDGLYGQLPTLLLVLAIVIGAFVAIAKVWVASRLHEFDTSILYDLALAILVLGGIYLILYLISHGKWVGDGDWLLGIALALPLGHPFLALLVLFLSNFFACLVVLPQKNHQKKIHFGPFMASAFIVVYCFANEFLALLT